MKMSNLANELRFPNKQTNPFFFFLYFMIPSYIFSNHIHICCSIKHYFLKKLSSNCIIIISLSSRETTNEFIKTSIIRQNSVCHLDLSSDFNIRWLMSSNC